MDSRDVKTIEAAPANTINVISEKSHTKSRIKILDGFRAIAIISVMLFHFFSRYAAPFNQASLYPYKDKYNFFTYGNVGVEFFFIISGFVIFFTLEKTLNFLTFWKKRFIRLFPSMLVATLITFLVFRLFDDTLIFPDSHRVANILTSLTFIKPIIFNHFFHLRVNLNYINGSYWSLWPEIQFYFFASALYYINKKNFFRNFSISAIFLICVDYVLKRIDTDHIFNSHLPLGLSKFYEIFIGQYFNLISFLPLFSAGMCFYLLYKHKTLNEKSFLSIKLPLAFFLIYIIYTATTFQVDILYFIVFSLFFCFIYFPEKLLILNNKLIVKIGVASYFLYLIHENIGILIINKTGKFFTPFGMAFTISVMLFLILISIIYSETIEKKLSAYLKKYLIP